MPNEEPSKAVLLERREERDLVGQARGILEEQRDLLAHQMMDLVREAEALEEKLAGGFDAARHAIRTALMRHAANGVRRWARTETALAAPGWSVRRLLGTQTVEWEAVTDSAPPALADSPEISLELERAVVRFHQLLATGTELAAVYNNLERVTAAFRRTQRRVNALEHIVLPDLERSIRHIGAFLEEMDRENLVRAHRLKKT
jgi:V/A-type H+-transporting ATPase subunit D